MRIINFLLFIFLLLNSDSGYAQERIYDLEYNPQLYYKYGASEASSKIGLVKGNYLIVPSKLNLPFFEDFSRDKLFQRPSWENLVIDTGINRSIQLGADKDTFILDTAWTYVFSNGAVIDSNPKAQVQLILNDDLFDPTKKSDTINGWEAFYRYTSSTDSVKAEPDSFLVYSKFDLIQDTNAYWLERQVFLNGTNVENKLSNQFASFEGLNENGLPYDPDNTGSGSADTLTSQAFDLSTFSISDDIYLSFFYLSTGYGNKPEPEDSLILEFNKSGTWDMVWYQRGFASVNDVEDEWKVVMIPLDDNFYFTETFQFRFRNKATLTGNNDHWHIDYVYLAANRSATDTVIRDVAVTNPPTNFLERYTSMPRNQYEGFESQETAQEIFLSFKNNFSVSQTISYSYMVNEIDNNGIVTNRFHLPKQGTALPGFSPFTIGFPTSAFAPLQLNSIGDSSLIELVSYIDEIPSALSAETDTARVLVPFYNYLAYDDGSAEKAYGLEGPGLKNFAYEFDLNVPDTLQAIQIHFTQINFDASDLLFTLKIWKDIELTNDRTDDLIYSKEFQRPHYIDYYNGFATYVLDSPLLISGTFYVGWDQTDEDNIQVGLDMNNSAQEHMYYKIGNNWNSSLVEAAPMIRPVLGEELPVSIDETIVKPEKSFSIFPNPSSNVYNIAVNQQGEYLYQIYDLQGKRLETGRFMGDKAKFSLAEQVPGFYILQVADVKEQRTYAFRLIKL